MKLEIYKELEKKDRIIKLALREFDDGIMLGVITEHGLIYPRGTLLRINLEGSLYLPGNISPDFGFQLDEHGRLKTISG